VSIEKTMRKNLISPAAGIVLLVLCCAAPFLIAGGIAAVGLVAAALAPTRAQPALIAAALFTLGLGGAALFVRARRNGTARKTMERRP
jgi:hypothetical protein